MSIPTYRYEVCWSDAAGQYVGTYSAFPSLTWLDRSPVAALEGIQALVREALEGKTRSEMTDRR